MRCAFNGGAGSSSGYLVERALEDTALQLLRFVH